MRVHRAVLQAWLKGSQKIYDEEPFEWPFSVKFDMVVPLMIKKTDLKRSLKWAIVTGASSGIGRETALQLAEAGYSLYLISRRADRLKKLHSEIQKNYKVDSKVIAIDVQNKNAINQFIKAESVGLAHVEILVNNAGLAMGTAKAQDADIADWEVMIDTNLKGLLYLTRGLLPFLVKKKSGHIVNLGSVAGRWVYPGGSVYCATKYAVRAFTEGLRMDLMGTNIRVTNIEPGMVNTEFSLVRFKDQKIADSQYDGMTALSAKDIAESILWCVNRPGHVNIQELVIFPTDQAAVGPSYTQRKK